MVVVTGTDKSLASHELTRFLERHCEAQSPRLLAHTHGADVYVFQAQTLHNTTQGVACKRYWLKADHTACWPHLSRQMIAVKAKICTDIQSGFAWFYGRREQDQLWLLHSTRTNIAAHGPCLDLAVDWCGADWGQDPLGQTPDQCVACGHDLRAFFYSNSGEVDLIHPVLDRFKSKERVQACVTELLKQVQSLRD